MGLVLSSPSRLKNGLIAGIVAITTNTLLLKLAPLLNVKAEGGGLLKLLLQNGRPFTGHFGFLYTIWFSLLFHYLTGAVMVLIYLYFVSQSFTMPGWLKGSLFSLLPWLIDGFIVLPLLGQGWLGSDQLTVTGMFYFFTANWLFGLVLGALYARLMEPPSHN